jgi:hypothetical protein
MKQQLQISKKKSTKIFPSMILNVISLRDVERAWSLVPASLKNKYLVKTEEDQDPELTVRVQNSGIRTLYVDQDTMKIHKRGGTPHVLKPFSVEQIIRLFGREPPQPESETETNEI